MGKKYKSVEELKKDLETNFPWYLEVWYFFRYRMWNRLGNLKWQIPNILQRARKGWGHADTWDFSYYLAGVIAGGVTHLKEIKHGIPNEFWEKYKDEKTAGAEWDLVLDKIIYAFQLAKALDGDDKDISENWETIHKKKFEEGFDLFKKYYFNLWD